MTLPFRVKSASKYLPSSEAAIVLKVPFGDLGVFYCKTTSTLRFNALFSFVVFGTIGFLGPKPAALILS
jgi:hypothetical protein